MIKDQSIKALLSILFTLVSIITYAQKKEFSSLNKHIPKGHKLIETIKGDLNSDGYEDVVLILQSINRKNIKTDEFRGKLDLNRKGLVILFRKGNEFELILENRDCFSSQDEYSGAYIPPELWIEIKNGNLFIKHGQGANGFWYYTFRYDKSNFELIGYDTGYKTELNFECVVFDEESINLNTGRKQIKKVTSVDQNCKETYTEVWKEIKVLKKIELRTIKDLDYIEIDEIVKEK